MVQALPHLNATLNLVAAVLLVVGYVFVRRGNIRAHKWMMLSSFAVSVIFFISYLTYHMQVGSKPFSKDLYAAYIRYTYLAILATHVVLAAAVPFLAIATIYLGFREYPGAVNGSPPPGTRSRHRALARWTFPIWLYVSVTGVIVYLMRYQWFPG